MADGGHNDWSIGPLSQRYPDPLVKSLDPRFDKYRLPLASVDRLWTGSRWYRSLQAGAGARQESHKESSTARR